jgi:hypothetical protein
VLCGPFSATVRARISTAIIEKRAALLVEMEADLRTSTAVAVCRAGRVEKNRTLGRLGVATIHRSTLPFPLAFAVGTQVTVAALMRGVLGSVIGATIGADREASRGHEAFAYG